MSAPFNKFDRELLTLKKNEQKIIINSMMKEAKEIDKELEALYRDAIESESYIVSMKQIASILMNYPLSAKILKMYHNQYYCIDKQISPPSEENDNVLNPLDCFLNLEYQRGPFMVDAIRLLVSSGGIDWDLLSDINVNLSQFTKKHMVWDGGMRTLLCLLTKHKIQAKISRPEDGTFDSEREEIQYESKRFIKVNNDRRQMQWEKLFKAEVCVAQEKNYVKFDTLLKKVGLNVEDMFPGQVKLEKAQELFNMIYNRSSTSKGSISEESFEFAVKWAKNIYNLTNEEHTVLVEVLKTLSILHNKITNNKYVTELRNLLTIKNLEDGLKDYKNILPEKLDDNVDISSFESQGDLIVGTLYNDKESTRECITIKNLFHDKLTKEYRQYLADSLSLKDKKFYNDFINGKI